MPKTSSTGLKKETAAALSYIFGPLTGIIFIILESDSFVRFHALQSTFILGGIGLAASVLFLIPPLSSLLWLAYIAVLLTGAFKASQGEKWTVPIVGKFLKNLQ